MKQFIVDMKVKNGAETSYIRIEIAASKELAMQQAEKNSPNGWAIDAVEP